MYDNRKSCLAANALCALLAWTTAAETLAQLTPPKLSLTKTATTATVSAGEQIGFTIMVAAGASGGSASGITLSDPLPAGDFVNWSISSGSGNCSITGGPSAQTLTCSYMSLAPGGIISVQVVSDTVYQSCKTYNNTAYLTAANAPDLSASATVTVRCPSLSLTQTVDAANDFTIGFTITATNSGAAGTGTALGARIVDALPRQFGAFWIIDPPVSGCALYPADTQQSLRCDNWTLLPGQSLSVHAVTFPQQFSGTEKCAEYINVATLESGTSPHLTAYARSRIRCPGSPVFTSANGTLFNADEDNSFFVTATGTPAAAYQLSGTLPPGVSFDGTTGELHGKPDPTSVGLWPLTFAARNQVPPDATQDFALFVGNPPCSLDVDGNQSVTALTDGLLLIRAMLGLTGTAVTSGALGNGGNRNDWTAIRSFLNGRCGTGFAQ